MKINPVAIQSYQQATRQNRPDQPTAQQTASQAPETVAIRPQDESQPSRLAVRATPGNYAQYLSSEERQALDLLFARFKDTGRFGSAYTGGGVSTEEAATLGRTIDIKV